MNSTPNRPDLELPDDLEDAVRTIAAQVPALPQDLTRVRARAHVYRRRRAALRAAAAAVVVLALGAGVPVVRSLVSTDIIVGDPLGGNPIGLWQNRDHLPVTQGVPSGNHVPGSDGEIAAQLRTVNGKATVVPVGFPPGVNLIYAGPAPLPGGGLATIGNPTPKGTSSPIHLWAFVVDAAGRTVSSKVLPRMRSTENRPMPMTGSGTTLYWWQLRLLAGTPQQSVLISYNIAAGTLRELTPGSAPTGGLPYLGMQATDQRIVEWPAEFGRTCSADILDAGTGELITRLRPAIAGCGDVYFALSPDNKRVAALVTDRDDGTWSQRVLTIDPATGEIQKEFSMPKLAAGTDRTRLVSGIDWANGKTIRYARGVLPTAGTAAPAPIVLTLKL